MPTETIHHNGRGRRRRLSPRCAARYTPLREEPLEERTLLALTPQLLADINPAPAGIWAYDTYVEVGSLMYFSGYHSEGGGPEAKWYGTGVELWRTDGTRDGTYLVKDIHPTASSFPRGRTNVNGTLFFVANDGVHGNELWKSDGTAAGTVLVKDITPGSASTFAPTYIAKLELLNVNGTLFFQASDGVSGFELWKTDGTEAGTVMVKDFVPGSSNPRELTNVNGTLFFISAERGLWTSDGTAAGTVLVKDLRFDPYFFFQPSRNELTNVGGTLFFRANDGTHGPELWKSDGTPSGTVMVKDTDPSPHNSDLMEFTNVNGTLFFFSYAANNAPQVWKSDGTEAGTIVVKQFSPSGSGFGQAGAVAAGANLFFSFYNSSAGFELWKSDGTEAGTALVKDINPGIGDSEIDDLVNVGRTLFFTALNNEFGVELWKSDGTAAGTALVKDINPRGDAFQRIASEQNTRDISSLTNVGGTLYFMANAGPDGFELWKSNGTAAGTVLVPRAGSDTASSNPGNLFVAGDLAFFTATTGAGGNELWKTDGTPAGTALVKDIRPGAGSSSPTGFAEFNGLLYFIADDGVSGRELWKSDGTAAGTVMVVDLNPGSAWAQFGSIVEFKGSLVFRATDGVNGLAFWKSDGTAAGTVLVKDPDPGPGGVGDHFVNHGGILFFAAADEATGFELWKSDGTPDGTVLVKDVRPGASGSQPSDLISVGGKVFFRANNGVDGSELWVSDGTAEGTVLVKDIRPGSSGSACYSLTNVSGTLFFAANDGTHGYELWRSDGTADGTVLLTNIFAGGNRPFGLTNLNGTLFFDAGVQGLWKSDGTPAGTVQVLPGIARSLTNIGGRLFFGYSDANGSEPWISDGTAAGTVALANISPGSASSLPSGFVALSRRLVFAAKSIHTGNETWSLTVSPWHNFAGPLNVDASTEANPISPIDAVLVINYLNRPEGGGEVPAGATNAPPFVDVDGDNFVSPSDAVEVINWLNANRPAAAAPSTAAESEGPVAAAATFTVTTTLDSGPGSLRQAIVDANAAAGGGTIEFQIPASDPNFVDVDAALVGGDAEPDAWRIRPLTELPPLSNANAGITLDGRSQTTFGGDHNPSGSEIVLDGNGLDARALTVTTSGNAVLGLNIQRFGLSAVQILGGDNNAVAGNYIGTNATGTAAASNLQWGVLLSGGASGNRIGTNADGVNDATERNLISGNGLGGVSIASTGSDGNVVAGNYIGTNAAAAAAIPNTGRGVDINNGAQHNRIGTNADGVNDAAEGNLISGNSWDGISINGAGTSFNTIAGNLVGSDVTGELVLGNVLQGILVFLGATQNTIGGSAAGARNLISGNTSGGIKITGAATASNLVAGNYIGTNWQGFAPVPNSVGVLLDAGTTSNRIGTNGDGVADAAERNVISGNTNAGVRISGLGTSLNVVAGNYIGTDATGMEFTGNGTSGVVISAAATANLIGTNGDGIGDQDERNVLSGNFESGVAISDAGTDNNVVAGNYIGTNFLGIYGIGSVPNFNDGVLIQSGAKSNRIGTDGNGVRDAIEGNVISGNFVSGVNITGAGTSLNVVAGNFIGTDGIGSPISNGAFGVWIQDGAQRNVIGGTAPTAGNLIAFNNLGGVVVASSGGAGNAILGNSIYLHGDRGIDLNDDGPTNNDLGDVDGGPNRSQNFPELAAANLIGATMTVQYIVPSTAANATYPIRVEFFKLNAGPGGRPVFLAADTYATPGAIRPFVLVNVAVAGDTLVATATDAAGNTSEVSPFVTALAKPNPWQNSRNPLDVDDSRGDIDVSAIDAVLVINHLNNIGGEPVPVNAPAAPPYLDVTGDGFVAPDDAIEVINWLNAHPAVPAPAGEGESQLARSATTNEVATPEFDAQRLTDGMLSLLAQDALSTSRRRRRS